MLIQFFRSDKPAFIILLFIVGCILWIPSFFAASVINDGLTDAVPSYWFTYRRNYPVADRLTAFVLNFCTAVILNIVVQKFRLIKKNTNLVPLAYLLFSGAVIQSYHVTPFAVNNLMLVFFLNNILSLPVSNRVLSSIFNSAFILSVISIIYFPYIILLIPYWIALLIFRPFYFREWVVAFLGIMLPYVYLFSFLYVSNQWSLLGNFIYFEFFARHPSTFTIYPFLGSLLILIPAFFYNVTSVSQNIAIVRKSLNINFLIFVSLGLLILFVIPSKENVLVITAIPLSIVAGGYFSETKFVRLTETLLWIFIATILFNHVKAL